MYPPPHIVGKCSYHFSAYLPNMISTTQMIMACTYNHSNEGIMVGAGTMGPGRETIAH